MPHALQKHMNDITPRARDREPKQTAWQDVSRRVGIYIRAAIGDPHGSDDVLQRTAAAVLKKQHRFDPDKGDWVGWVMGIARNEILMHRRSKARGRLVFKPELLENLAERAATMPEVPQRAEALKYCIGKLAPKAREAIRLRYHTELNNHDAAKRLGIQQGNLNVMLHRARAALKDCIEKQEKENHA